MIKKETPLISVIVPVYNAEKYIERCIASIVSQSYANLEILLINDGSTDRSGLICEEWAKKDNRIIYLHKENTGVSATRNAGLKMATGEYVVFLDSDDYMLPDMCQTLCEKIKEKDSDCIVCSILEPYNNVWGCNKDTDYTSLDSLRKDYIALQQTELLSPCWNKIYKRALIKSEFPEDMSFGEDLVFCLDYLKQCERISFVRDILIFHEKENQSSLVHRVDLERLMDIERVLKATISFYGENPPIQIFNKYVRDLSVYCRQYMKDPNKGYRTKVKELGIWRKHSKIGSLDINRLSCHWKTRLQMFWLKHELWWLLNLQINRALC